MMRCWATAVAAALVCALLGYCLAAQAQIPREAQQYRRDLVRNARMIWGLDAPIATFAAQIHQESAWRPDARSPYAHGLAQFTPATADWIGGVDAALAGADTGNPVWALRALVRYDAWLYARVPIDSPIPLLPSPLKGEELGSLPLTGRECLRWTATLRAYNGGLGWLRREAKTGKPCAAFRSAANCRENLAYPRQILQKWQPLYARWGPGVSCV